MLQCVSALKYSLLKSSTPWNHYPRVQHSPTHEFKGLLLTVNVREWKGSSTQWNMYEVKNVMKNRVYFVDVSLQNRVYFFRVYFFRVYFFEFIFLGPSLFFKKPSLFFWNRVYFKKNRVYFQKMLWKINSLLRPSLKNKLRVYFKNKLGV